jgi:adenylosuccinate synthase
LREKIEKVCFVKNQVIKALYGTSELLNANSVYREIISWKEKIAPLIYDTTHYLNQVRGNKRILLEGQLGALRDIEHGIYPYVTSSSPLAGYGAVSTGIPPWSVTEIITVIKAYSSCVGAGIFVSEIYDNAADELRKRGGDSGEYGATTGRPRRMGWFDTVASRYGCMIQGTTEIALSMLDVLGYLEKIPVCVAYEIEGHTIDTFPVSYQLQKAKPVYEYLDGWGCDISGIGTYKALPPQARAYVEFIEAKLGLPVTMISNGPKRDDIIYRK